MRFEILIAEIDKCQAFNEEERDHFIETIL